MRKTHMNYPLNFILQAEQKEEESGLDMEEFRKFKDRDAELLTLTHEVDEYGNTRYRNKKGQLHRIHGPACITCYGTQYWYKNDKCHREDGPALINKFGKVEYCIEDMRLTKEKFIQWQIANGIKPIE